MISSFFTLFSLFSLHLEWPVLVTTHYKKKKKKKFNEISYSRNELLNAPFTDITALSYSALSQLNYRGILANHPQTYHRTHRGKKAGRRRMEKLAQLALRPDQTPTVNLTTSTSNIGKISTPNVHDESKLQLCVLNTQSICNKSDEFVDFVLQNKLDLFAISETWFKSDDDLIPHECTPAGYSLHLLSPGISPVQKRLVEGVALLFRSSLSVSMKNDNIDYLTFESLHAEII